MRAEAMMIDDMYGYPADFDQLPEKNHCIRESVKTQEPSSNAPTEDAPPDAPTTRTNR